MFLLCIPKNVEFEIFKQHYTDTISHDYSDFNMMQNQHFTFRDEPAYWLLYEGIFKNSGSKKHGYTIMVDRGNKGLIISLSADADDAHRYSPIFQSGVRAIKLL